MRFLKMNFEKFLKISVISLFAIVILVQVVMSVPELNLYFCRITNTEYIETFSESELIKSSLVTLKINEPDSNVIILLNGEEIACFTQNQINVSVFDNSVLEIDGRRAKKTFEVAIICDNDIRHNLGETITVDKNIAMVGRIFID